jgi:lipid II:glycine glycyltransferase (peptidoglycan interpeptide bridge formation enzyme)
MLVWDRHAAYFLAGGSDPELRTSGAAPLVVWHLIRFAAQRTNRFDFEGSVIEPVEHFFRGFGGKLVPVHRIMKFPFWLRAHLMLTGKI